MDPTYEQLIASLAAAFLPFAGPTGVAVSAAIPALEGLLASFKNSGKTTIPLADLVAIVAGGSVGLAKLKADIAQMPD